MSTTSKPATATKPETDKPATAAAKPAKQSKPKNPALEGETKSARFKRVAGKRLAKALKMLKGLEQTAKGASYEYSPEQVTKVMTLLKERVQMIDRAFGERFAATDAEKGSIDL